MIREALLAEHIRQTLPSYGVAVVSNMPWQWRCRMVAAGSEAAGVLAEYSRKVLGKEAGGGDEHASELSEGIVDAVLRGMVAAVMGERTVGWVAGDVCEEELISVCVNFSGGCTYGSEDNVLVNLDVTIIEENEISVRSNTTGRESASFKGVAFGAAVALVASQAAHFEVDKQHCARETEECVTVERVDACDDPDRIFVDSVAPRDDSMVASHGDRVAINADAGAVERVSAYHKYAAEAAW